MAGLIERQQFFLHCFFSSLCSQQPTAGVKNHKHVQTLGELLYFPDVAEVHSLVKHRQMLQQHA